MLVHYPSIMATFPRNTEGCEAMYDHDPLSSGVDCRRQVVPLRKLIYADFANTDPDMFFLWDAAQFSKDDLLHLMSFHVDGGGNSTNMYDAACQWLKSNETIANWRMWLKIHHDDQPSPICDAPLSWDPVSKQCVSAAVSSNKIPPEILISVGILGAVVIALAALVVSPGGMPAPSQSFIN